MTHFFKKHKILFLAVLVAVFVFGAGYAVVNQSLLEAREYTTAQLITIETNLLKTWQQRSGIHRNLSYGSTGSDVHILQRMLAQNPRLYPEQKVTGYYGSLTAQAVTRFQKEHNLSVTGTVNRQTRKEVNEAFLSQLCPSPNSPSSNLSLHDFKNGSSLPIDYVPNDLVDISGKVSTNGATCLSQEAADSLQDMFRDAWEDGVIFQVTSGYRKPDIQQYLYDFWLRVEGSDALDEIARPGESEHQLGTAVDLTDASIGYAPVSPRFEDAKGMRWLQDHAHEYGFVLSYPKGKERITGYEYEPWHWRYVGKKLARELSQENKYFFEWRG